MIWSEDRVARKDYPCDWGEGDRCPLGPIKAGTRYTYSTASPFDSLSGADVWVNLRLHLEHRGATTTYDELYWSTR